MTKGRSHDAAKARPTGKVTSEDEPLDLGTVDFDHKGIGTGSVEPKLVEVDRHGDCLSIARRTLNDN
jgi:hypothetical protein